MLYMRRARDPDSVLDLLAWWRQFIEDAHLTEQPDLMYDEQFGPDRPGTLRWESWMGEDGQEELAVQAVILKVAAVQRARLNVKVAHDTAMERRFGLDRTAEEISGSKWGAGRPRTWSDDQLRDAVQRSRNWSEVARRLGLPTVSSTVKKRVYTLGLDISHFTRSQSPLGLAAMDTQIAAEWVAALIA